MPRNLTTPLIWIHGTNSFVSVNPLPGSSPWSSVKQYAIWVHAAWGLKHQKLQAKSYVQIYQNHQEVTFPNQCFLDRDFSHSHYFPRPHWPLQVQYWSSLSKGFQSHLPRTHVGLPADQHPALEHSLAFTALMMEGGIQHLTCAYPDHTLPAPSTI